MHAHVRVSSRHACDHATRVSLASPASPASPVPLLTAFATTFTLLCMVQVAAFCADPKRCVRYTAKLYRSSGWKSVVWLPEEDWRANAELSPRPECLVDTVHTDLVNPFTGTSHYVSLRLTTTETEYGDPTHLPT